MAQLLRRAHLLIRKDRQELQIDDDDERDGFHYDLID